MYSVTTVLLPSPPMLRNGDQSTPVNVTALFRVTETCVL